MQDIIHYLLLLLLLLLFENVIFHSMLELSNTFFYMYMFYSESFEQISKNKVKTLYVNNVTYFT